MREPKAMHIGTACHCASGGSPDDRNKVKIYQILGATSENDAKPVWLVSNDRVGSSEPEPPADCPQERGQGEKGKRVQRGTEGGDRDR